MDMLLLGLESHILFYDSTKTETKEDNYMRECNYQKLNMYLSNLVMEGLGGWWNKILSTREILNYFQIV